MSSIKSLLINSNEVAREVVDNMYKFSLQLTHKTVEVEGAPNYTKQLNDMYGMIGCERVEHLTLEVADSCVVDLWFDEEGKLKSDKEHEFSIPLIQPNGMIYDIIIGNCLVTKSNREGDIASLTDEDIEKVLKYVIDAYGGCFVRCSFNKSE